MFSVKVLPGQPTDGSGTVCIHLIVPDDNGSFVQPHMLYIREDQDESGRIIKQLDAKPIRCRIACDPKRSVKPVIRNGVTIITHHTDDPRAITCPKCKGSPYYTKAMELLLTRNRG